jgi:16S rRNA (guanine1207-N2)-methyltransferase
MPEIRCSTPFGDLELHRLPERRRETLRAWDAADLYLLREYAALGEGGRPPLVVNDAFGALTLPLWSQQPASWSDSELSRRAVLANRARNGLGGDAPTWIDSLQAPPPADRVLFKLPKSLAFFEDQLLRLRPTLAGDAVLLFAGMQKNMPRRIWTLLESIIGPCETLPGRHKAKLIRVRVDPALSPPENPWPTRYTLQGTDFELINHSALFSREQLDIGTRFLLENLPRTEGPGDIVDLGCGNGVIGLMAMHRNPEARAHFVDESSMAIASARENLRQVDPDLRRCRFTLGNALDGFAAASADLVLSNPPFHQQQAVADAIVRQMFRQTAHILRPQGEFWLVANRHLDYKKPLRRLFSRVEVPAANRKFVILRAIAGS